MTQTHGFDRRPGFPMSFRPAEERVRVVFAGETIADSTSAMVMDEDAHLPVYYLPREDIRMDLLTRTAHASH